MIKTGLERVLDEEIHLLQGKKLGLVINHTSVDASLTLSLDRFMEKGLQVKAVFAPEHGFRGNIPAEETVSHGKDSITGIPIFSLYGNSAKPTAEMLDGIEILVFDMQDLGVRFYTYLYSLANCMKAAKELGVEIMVLDRPNPINGITIEGNIVEPQFHSFVGNYGLPIRHGMTVGELAGYFNKEYEIGTELKVVTMKGWERRMWYEDTKLHWIMPSPNATGKEMTALYPGTCFFEGTNVSEGRGTTTPFQVIGAPWIDSYELIERLEPSAQKGVLLRPVTFTPYTSKYKDEQCNGIQIHIDDYSQYKPIETALTILDAIRILYPDDFQWKKTEDGNYFIDFISGTDNLRKTGDAGQSLLEWMRSNEVEAKAFEKKRAPYLLYE